MGWRWVHVGAVAASIMAFAAAPALAGDAAPSPDKALKRAIKLLQKQKSFAFQIECRGGLADSPKKLHCDQPLTQSDFSTEVYRPVMKVEDPRALILYGLFKGAAFDGKWKALLAAEKAKQIPYLVRTPEQTLATAARYAKKKGYWLDEGVEVDTWEKPDKDKKSGSSTVSRGGRSSGETRIPTRLRV
ncbi:hypothetical protein ACFL59_13730, partial [Planctomycetota bacterium]